MRSHSSVLDSVNWPLRRHGHLGTNGPRRTVSRFQIDLIRSSSFPSPRVAVGGVGKRVLCVFPSRGGRVLCVRGVGTVHGLSRRPWSCAEEPFAKGAWHPLIR